MPVTSAEHDPLNEGMALFRRIFDSIRNPAKGVRPCRDEAEACEAVRWLFIEGGRHARGRLDPEQAIEAAESHIGIRLEAYQRRTVDCWRREPWIIVVCGTERRTTGMCLAIPLGDFTYEAVRKGTVNALHCTGKDVVSPSPNLFVEAAAMRPHDGERKWRLPNLQLALAVVTQHARLTSAPGVVTKQPMRLLAFAGTRAHGRWLKRFRYQPVGTRLNGTPFALMERRVRYGERGGRDAPHIGVWQELQLSLGTDLKAGNDDNPRSSSDGT